MNKNIKGFTLIELLAVIVILAAIMLIIIPLVTNNVKEGADVADTQNKESIELSGKNWASDNKNKLPEDQGEICVSVSALIQEGYLDSNVSSDYIDGSVFITNIKGVYYYNFYTEEEKKCDTASIYKTITFDYTTNGGDESYNTTMSVIPGDSVTSLPDGQGSKEDDWKFVGWNTNQNAHSGFEEFTMPTRDVTLYAIYKKKIDINFVVQKFQDKVIAKASKDKASCNMYNNDTDCTITTPTLTSVAGTKVLGWSTDKSATSTNIKSGDKIDVKKSDTYYSIIDILDKTAPECNLKIVDGTFGENNWYNSNVTIRMTSSDSGGSNLTDYGITTSSNATYNSSASVIHSADGKSITYYGYVMDGVGNTNKCSITFKRDVTNPTCTSSGGGQSSSSVTIKGTCSDATSGCVQTTVSKKITSSGTYSPGNVEDNAGNVTSCPTQTVKIGQTISTGGYNSKWRAIYNSRSSCDYWAAKYNGGCPDGVKANTIGRVDISYSGSKVKVTWRICMGPETWIRNGKYVYLRIYKGGSQVNSWTLKGSSGKWNNACYSGTVSKTLGNGSYTVKFEGNSTKPSFNHNMGTFTLK